jgi:Bifunctional DNA primase/polymerase, N-terminal
MTGNPTLRQALAYAARGWPVFPCQPGQKTPATPHGYRNASTDPGQINAWFDRRPDCNLAIATGFPGPDVLDVDQHGPAGDGFTALIKLRDAKLLDGAAAYVRTPSGGMHAYFTGTHQHCGHLPDCHLDFLATGGYVLAPPSTAGSKPYRILWEPGGRGALNWDTATRLLQPQRQHQQPRRPAQASSPDLGHLARWVATQPEGNRNAGLFWAANRALETDPTADLSPLADAARQAGLADPEITRTLDSARRTAQPNPGYEPEAGDDT